MADNDALLKLAGELLAYWPDGAPDGFDLQNMLVKHGVLEETTATEADCQEEWAQDYGIEPGDTVCKLTELGKGAQAAVKDTPAPMLPPRR